MKLIQTPSLITGAILGASLITLSAASNDSVLGGLNVFVPGTTVSSADVNDNFTMVVDEVSALEGRLDNLEGSVSVPQYVSGSLDPLADYQVAYTVPQGKILLVTNISASVIGSGSNSEMSAIMKNSVSGETEVICRVFQVSNTGHYNNANYTSPSGYVIPEDCTFEIYAPLFYASWTGILIDAQ